jgi:hypothetical protein
MMTDRPRQDAYFLHLAMDLYRALPNMPKPARRFAYNAIELMENDVLDKPAWGDHPLQQPKRLIMRQLVAFERAMAADDAQ